MISSVGHDGRDEFGASRLDELLKLRDAFLRRTTRHRAATSASGIFNPWRNGTTVCHASLRFR